MIWFHKSLIIIYKIIVNNCVIMKSFYLKNDLFSEYPVHNFFSKETESNNNFNNSYKI